MIIVKEGIYFIKSDPEIKTYVEQEQNRYFEHIPMTEIKSVFIKQEQKEQDACNPSAAPQFLRKLSRYVPAAPLSPTRSKSTAESAEAGNAERNVTSRHGYEFQIETFNEDDANNATKKITGEFSGKSFHIRVGSRESCTEIVTKIKKSVKHVRSDAERKGIFELLQLRVLKYYKSSLLQAIMACLILAVQSLSSLLRVRFLRSTPLIFLSQNFGLDAYSAQIASADSSDSRSETRKLLDQINTLLVFIFTAELGVNIFCRWFWPFFNSAWCIFDLIVVGISLISLAPTGLPFDLLLLFRCCRVLRVVGRFKTVNAIFSILMRSIVPMASAFFLVFLFSSMCEFISPR